MSVSSRFFRDPYRAAVCRTVALSVLATLWSSTAAAQATKAGVVTTLEGNVTAARATGAQPVPLKFKDDVFVNDRVVTGDRSLARLLLGGKAVVSVRERSALTITEMPGRSTVELDSGKIAVAVAKDKMRPGEQIEVKTPNAVAAVRGTVFVVEIIRASASASDAQGGVTVNHYVFSGQISLSVGTQIIPVGANNFASVTGGVVNSGIMSPAMRASAGGGFRPSGMPVVSGAEGEAKEAVMSSTVATFSTTALQPFVVPTPTPIPSTIPQPSQQNVPLQPGGPAFASAFASTTHLVPSSVGAAPQLPPPAPQPLPPPPPPLPPLPYCPPPARGS